MVPRNEVAAIGIDVGMKGGIALVIDGELTESWVMPTDDYGVDRVELSHILKNCLLAVRNPVCFIEKQWGRPSDGGTRAFSHGHGYGIIRATVGNLFIGRRHIAPVTWQAGVFIDEDKRTDGIKLESKERALKCAQRLFPDELWLPSRRHRKPHDGIIDAALLAWWGYGELKGE